MTQAEKTEALAKWAGWTKVASVKDMATLVDYTRYTIEDYGECVVRLPSGTILDTWRPFESLDHVWLLVDKAYNSGNRKMSSFRRYSGKF